MLARYAHVYSKLLVQLAGVLAVYLMAWWKPGIGNSWFRAVEDFSSRLAVRKRLAIGVVFIATVGIRVLLLPLLGVPLPWVSDENSYLLMGDTFAHGRLANPAHPEWPSFETFHVLSQPTYSSIFPPAQGLALAIGEVLGHPWIGVLLSIGAMCAAIVWMLQGWMPARWALLGGVLTMLNLGVVSYWMNGYMGGAMAAIGGALVLGALPRMQRQQRVRDSLLMGLGIAILANSRPVEGFVFCLPVAVVLLVWLGGKSSPPLRVSAPRLIGPLIVVVLLTGAFIGYYNWRLTGNALLLPHALYLNEHFTPIFLWQRLKPIVHYRNQPFEDIYNGWTREFYRGTRQDIFRVSLEKVRAFMAAFLWAGSLPILVAMPLVLRDRKVRLLVLQFMVCTAGLFLVVYSGPHYTAPITCVIYALLVQGIRHLRTIGWKSRRAGIAFSRAAIVLLVVATGGHLYHVVHDPDHPYLWAFDKGRGSDERVKVEQLLEHEPGNQLILVRYAPSHNAHHEWVYNSADIDGQKILWARELGSEQDRKLLSYFKDRKVWLFEPERDWAHLKPYPLETASAR